MKLLLFCLIIIALFVFLWFKNNNVYLDLKSFFKKGFKKIDSEFGLYCFCGKQGKGKTFSSCKFCIDRLKHNDDTIMITNVFSFKLLDYQDRILYEANIFNIMEIAIRLKDAGKDVLIFYDEIFTIITKNNDIGKETRSFISQLRKRQIVFVTTAQEWGEINITFRKYVRFKVDCNMLSLPFSHNAFSINKVCDGETVHWNEMIQDFDNDVISTNIFKCSLKVAQSYDTFETIQVDTSKRQPVGAKVAKQLVEQSHQG